MPMSRIDLAVAQIEFARNYTNRLLDNTKPEDWFRFPKEGVTHIAWQVGHVAMAQYRLAQERVRGRQPGDADLVSDEFLGLFARETTVAADPNIYPAAAEIRRIFDKIHQQTLAELKGLKDQTLDEPVLKPHHLVKTKFWALLWSAQHEMLHGGQIGLLRRLLGYAPLW